MSHSIAVAPAREARAARAGMAFGWPLALAAIAFLLLWLEIIFQLQSEWSLNPQYGYGWTVPFLAGLVVLSALDLPARTGRAALSWPNDKSGAVRRGRFVARPSDRGRES